MQRVERSIRVAAPISQVYEAWRNFESFPDFMEHVEQVRMVDGDGYRSHWKLRGPGGTSAEYDAELSEEEPNRSIGWRSIGGDMGTSGNVTFTETQDGSGPETLVHVVMQWYDPPGGVLGEAFSRIFSNPEQMVEEDLHRFKDLMERGAMSGVSTGGMSSSLPGSDAMAHQHSSIVGTGRGTSMDTMGNTTGHTTGLSAVGSGVSIADHTYDLITTLQSKLEAVGIYETFIEDCREAGAEECAQLFEEIWHDDQRHVNRLAAELERLAQNGLFMDRKAA
jgi:uncharacterized membrane protein